jgi:hypothetical protein
MYIVHHIQLTVKPNLLGHALGTISRHMENPVGMGLA